MRRKMTFAAVGVVTLLIPATAQAHVSITLFYKKTGTTEKYVIRIPTEGKVATTAAELDVPEGVVVETMQAPAGWKYEVKRAEDRIVSVVWQVDVKPGEFVEVAFVARNPRSGDKIVWILRQKFADGTTQNWTTAPNGTTRPTAVTQLLPAAAK